MIKIWFYLIATVMLTMMFAGCSSDDIESPNDTKSEILGTWELVEYDAFGGPQIDSMMISFSRDGIWETMYSFFGNKTDDDFHGKYTLINKKEDNNTFIQADQEGEYLSGWILRLWFSDDIYTDYRIIKITDDKMYLMSWGYLHFTYYYTFQRY